MSKTKIISILTASAISLTLIASVSYTTVINSNSKNKSVNKVLLTQTTSKEYAVVVNNKAPLVLYESSNTNSKITSYISVGEMLTIEGQDQGFYKVKVKETGAIGYIATSNAQIIKSGVNIPFKAIDKKGSIINVSSVVYLRQNPTMDSQAIGELTNGTYIEILGSQGDWYKISINGNLGYVYGEYIGLNNKNEEFTGQKISDMTVTKNSTNVTNQISALPVNPNTTYTSSNTDVVVRSEPNWNSKAIKTIKHATVPVKIISSNNKWDKIELSNGDTGYVPSGSLIGNIVSTASDIAKDVNSTINTTSKNIKNINNNVKSNINTATNTANNVANNIGSIIDSASNVVNTINNNAKTTANNVANNINDVNNNIKSNINHTAKNIQNINNNVASTIKNTGNTMSNVSNSVNSATQSAQKTANDVNKQIASTMNNAAHNINQINNTVNQTNKNIDNTVKNINDGINSNINSTANNINTINNGIKNAANKVSDGINSINKHIANIL